MYKFGGTRRGHAEGELSLEQLDKVDILSWSQPAGDRVDVQEICPQGSVPILKTVVRQEAV